MFLFPPIVGFAFCFSEGVHRCFFSPFTLLISLIPPTSEKVSLEGEMYDGFRLCVIVSSDK